MTMTSSSCLKFVGCQLLGCGSALPPKIDLASNTRVLTQTARVLTHIVQRFRRSERRVCCRAAP